MAGLFQISSSLIHPLNKLLCQDQPWRWTKSCQQAFVTAKKKLVSPNVLVHYDPSRLTADASAYGVGAQPSYLMYWMMVQLHRGPSYYYSQIEKEALSWVVGVSIFQSGRKFTLVTDHKPLLGP